MRRQANWCAGNDSHTLANRWSRRDHGIGNPSPVTPSGPQRRLDPSRGGDHGCREL
jgi:hypothetical protein